ncbi:MAG: HD domain-containing protein [Candidatus Bathyarchaeia archaeon]|jgi:hypothetical protein
MSSINFDDIENAINDIASWWIALSKDTSKRHKKGFLRDPIYGYHELSACEYMLLDSPPLQRLRHISQLGFGSIVYPGANHTRFEHSIGVASVASRIIKTLKKKHETVEPILKIEDNEIWTTKIAGYLHDIGHLPFSHAGESIFKALDFPKIIKEHYKIEANCPPHELFSYMMANTEYIKEIIENVSKKINITLDSIQISKTILGIHTGEKRYISEIIHGETDADRIDYLIRDAYYTGVPHGKVDIDHLARSFCAIKKSKQIWLAIEERGLEAVEALYSSRDLMYPTVYLHHTCRIAETMLTHLLYRAHKTGKFNLLDLLKMNDQQLLSELAKKGYEKTVNDLQYRRIHKRLLVIRRRDIFCKEKPIDEQENDETIEHLNDLNEFFASWNKLVEFEKELISNSTVAGLKEDSILISVPKKFIVFPKKIEDLSMEKYLPVKLRQGGDDMICNLSPIIQAIETLSASLRSSVIVAVDASIKNEDRKILVNEFKKKFEEKFNLSIREEAFFGQKG